MLFSSEKDRESTHSDKGWKLTRTSGGAGQAEVCGSSREQVSSETESPTCSSAL